MNRPVFIDRAEAKNELKRIDAEIQFPLILIGGLAVQQFHDARNSKDIDLICDAETANKLIDQLYPSKDWDVVNTQDDYRPDYRITNKVSNLTIHFGPKILERGEYPFLSWDLLKNDSIFFRFEGDNFSKNVKIPAAHDLAYTKLISFISRFAKSPDKSRQDLIDFINLSNHKSFCAARLYDLIRKHKVEAKLKKDFKEIIEKSDYARELIEQSCLSYFRDLFLVESKVAYADIGAEAKKISLTDRKFVYFAAPHKNIDINSAYCRYLYDVGLGVKLPLDEVSRKLGDPSPPPTKAAIVRQICIDAIQASDAVVVDVDHYGLDTAWEIGFAEGLGKPVLGVTSSYTAKEAQHHVNRRAYSENFMHGWGQYDIYSSIQDFLDVHRNDKVYMAGSFNNRNLDKIEDYVKQEMKNVVFPKDHVPSSIGLPKDYPLVTRVAAIDQMLRSDIISVIIPIYGMDTSWQIGFAAAKSKKIVGIHIGEPKATSAGSNYSMHWMHGWKEKDVVVTGPKLAAVLAAYFDSKLI